jgi:hypothetical protein
LCIYMDNVQIDIQNKGGPASASIHYGNYGNEIDTTCHESLALSIHMNPKILHLPTF